MEIDELTVQTVVWLLVDIAALNWGLQEFAEVNLVTELLGSGNAGIAYAVIGVAGAASLAAKFGFVDLSEI